MNSKRLAVGLLVVAALVAGFASTPAFADPVVISVGGQANVFGAGHSGGNATPQPGGGGGGIAPPSYALAGAGPGSFITFTGVTGIVSCCSGSGANGPDGGTAASGNTDITSYNGISGILHSNRTMFLVGVFLSNAEPADPAPARLAFSTGGGPVQDSFASLSPLLNQTFFIGDGLTGAGSGAQQVFYAPTGATRLFLGFADAFEFGNPTSAPGFYNDNTGSLSGSFELTNVPEPGTLLLLGAGLGLLGARRRRG